MRSKHEIVLDMAVEEAKMLSSLQKLRAYTIELASLVPDEPEIVDPPPITGPEDRIPGKLTGDMSVTEVASAISEAKPGTTFECFGALPAIRIGGILGDKPGKHNQVAHHADGSPIRDIHFVRGPDTYSPGWKMPEVQGILFHNSLGGFDNILFDGINARPRQDGDRAAILFEEHFDPDQFQGGLFSFKNAHVYAPAEWTAFSGYGYKQTIVIRSSRFHLEGLTYSPPKEHGTGYFHNIRGDSVGRDLQVMTRAINGQEVGCGRTLGQVQERRSDGLEGYGNILFENVSGRLCGSEGVVSGNTASGGSAFTTGGHNGTITWKNCHADEPMTGGVVTAWEETESNGEAKGFGSPAVNGLILDGITWTKCNHPLASNRRAINLDSVRLIHAQRVQDIVDPLNDSRVKLGPDIGDMTWI